MNDLIGRQAAIKELRELAIALYGYDATSIISCAIYKLQNLPSAQPEGYVKIPETGIDDLSDGFHTFRQLYYQRMMLFATIVRQNKSKAWKSLRHEDGELCFGGGWFIVGIDTPEGSYTYHYEDNYFSLFDCEELKCGKHWDGHTEKDVTRLLSLPSAQPDLIRCKDCKHRKVNEHYGEKGYLKLKAMCELDTGDVFQLGRDAENDDWYCADAEIKGDTE